MDKLLRVMVCLVMLCGVSAIASAAAFEQGDDGQEVVMIQTKLTSLGYQVGVDGDYGDQTTLAVKAFQQDHGLTADGVVGTMTYRTLMGRDIPVSRDSSGISIRRMIQTANRYTGVPYVFGGATPDGFDCSGFTRFVYAKYGINLPRMADEQYAVGQSVSYNRLQPGDLVFFSTYEPGASHSGIYLGNGKFISATSSRGVAVDHMESSYWGARYIGARRVL